MRHSATLRICSVLISFLCIWTISASCANAQSVIFGEFSDPVLAGNILPLPGHQAYFDNTSTAYYLIGNSTDGTLAGTPPGQRVGSQLVWGDDPGSSLLEFHGRTVPSDPTVPFDLGYLAFGNGTSSLQSLIFGATLTFYVGPPEPNAIDPPNQASLLSDSISIGTTENLAVPGSEAHDADFISLSDIPNKTFNVYEGYITSIELYGYITGEGSTIPLDGGNPTLHLTDMVLDPGGSQYGFIGNGQPAFAVPEPSSLILGIVGGLSCLGYTCRQCLRSGE